VPQKLIISLSLSLLYKVIEIYHKFQADLGAFIEKVRKNAILSILSKFIEILSGKVPQK